MSNLKYFNSISQMKRIETIRQSKLLVLACSNLDQEIIPKLYSHLKLIGHVKHLDVLIHSRGGVVNAARRIALLLRKFTDKLSFIVPYYCESSGTILALSADEIISGDMAIFSPIDPHLSGSSGGGGESTLSFLDIKQFGDMCERWFGVDAAKANEEQVSLLCNSIFPPTLTAFYRITQEAEQIADELLSNQLTNVGIRKKVIGKLMHGYNSHHYAITTDEMYDMGLNIIRDGEVEDLAWVISEEIQATVGGSLRHSVDDPWVDTMILSSEKGYVRYNQPDGLAPRWNQLEVNE
ncbi:SDH family Clp fold serine proteinase [Kangiella koreensis]|uniref:Serine dehydrogenase proteinase n=1 Tax=Kangiella koreensis (strain DSM 16069 / JCM 12317 / KCTC 12182 / SW-125) TaxID=523791 RepID=C7RCI9_KANKD|nr:hypothetical protein [Kangiella koreensis]ACV26981.1 protein of unknown function DUF114 [Kangiella koreensis DSM 16069]